MIKIPPIPPEKRAKAQPFIDKGYFTEETLYTYWAEGFLEGYWEGYGSSIQKIKQRATEAQFRQVASSAICHMFEEKLSSCEMAKVVDMPVEEVEEILLNNQLIPEQLKTYALTH